VTEDVRLLIVDHVPLIDLTVSQVLRRRRLPAYVTRDELLSAAQLGLVKAALRFNPDRGASFKTYALVRMYGAVIDELREASPLSRAAWKKYLAGDESVCRHYLDIDSHPELEAELSIGASQDQPLTVDFEQSALRQLLRTLPAREEKLLLLYYRDNLTMRAIGDRIGVNESRVSQLHARALRRLRRQMGASSWVR
jgi:RNA polymerase sigma factor for flagellar operon FliA